MSTWRFTLPMVLLACLVFACETPVPDDQIQSKVSSGAKAGDSDKKPTPPKKTKPPTTTTGAGTTTTPGANTTPTTTDAKPTLPTTPAPATTPAPSTTAPPAADPPPVTTPPPATNPPQTAQEDLVEIDCCVGEEFITCVGTGTQTCGDVNIDTDCVFDPTFDDLCL